jgi:CRISPR-associated endonuclease/helicase Cas3
MTDPEFWAKTTSIGEPGISVYEHMLNVGYVARCFAESSPKLLKRFQLRANEVAAIASLHDLGKISPGFQRKCEPGLSETPY